VLAVLGSPLFAVQADQVTVTGNVYTDPDRLDAIVDDLVGTPTLASTPSASSASSRRSRGSSERGSRSLPALGDDRDPRAAAMTTYQGPDGRFRVLDRDGRVLDVLEKYPFAYVLITGPDPVNLEPGDSSLPVGYAAAAELAKNLTGRCAGRSSTSTSPPMARLASTSTTGPRSASARRRDLFAKLVRLESVLAANPDREPGRSTSDRRRDLHRLGHAAVREQAVSTLSDPG
jgi:hypothetical protein